METPGRQQKRRRDRWLLGRPRWKMHVLAYLVCRNVDLRSFVRLRRGILLRCPVLSGGDSRRISLFDLISRNGRLLRSGVRRRKDVIGERAVHEILLKLQVSLCFQIPTFTGTGFLLSTSLPSVDPAIVG